MTELFSNIVKNRSDFRVNWPLFSFVNIVIILPRAEVPLGLEFAVFGDGDALQSFEAAAKASKRSLLDELPTRDETEVMGGEGSSILLRATVSHPEIKTQ